MKASGVRQLIGSTGRGPTDRRGRVSAQNIQIGTKAVDRADMKGLHQIVRYGMSSRG